MNGTDVRWSGMAAILLLASFATACGYSTSIDIAARAEDAEKFYITHRAELHEMRDVLLNNPQIISVSTMVDMKFVEGADKLDTKSEMLYRQLEATCSRLKILAINRESVFSGPEQGRLISITFFVFARMWAGSGPYVSIKYVPLAEDKDVYEREAIVMPMQDKGWYVVANGE